MPKIRVLIVDDSIVFRSQIRASLEGSDMIEVVGVASHGKIAIEKMKQTTVDLVTLDLEMPEMNGLETLNEMRKQGLKAQVIVFSSQSQKGAKATIEALNSGASDFVPKPAGTTVETAAQVIRAELLPRILSLHSRKSVTSTTSSPMKSAPPLRSPFFRVNIEQLKPEVIVIGCSTGGPNALEQIFKELRPPICCPILIVQHMPAVFTASLASRLTAISGIETREAEHLEPLQPNRIYVAPGNFHMQLGKNETGVHILLDQGPLRNSVRPAVDPLFESAAQIFGSKCAAFVLTGMGDDGRSGAIAIKEARGAVMIQDKESCVVYGMPAKVEEAGAFDKTGNLFEIKQVLSRLSHLKGAA